MSTTETISACFVEPLDVLFLRGNQIFGEAGSYGEALMPPWPSVAAGALRSRLLVDDGVDLTAFGRGQIDHPQLGTPAQPGDFAIRGFQLARRRNDRVELLMPAPADLVIHEANDGSPIVKALRPEPMHTLIATSNPLAHLPVLTQTERHKPVSGWWLRESGWRNYLRGKAVTADDLEHASQLWRYDERIGIGLQSSTRSVADGKLFTARAIALSEGVGFAVTAHGATLPTSGSLRLGGDGRAGQLHSAILDRPEADHAAIAKAGRCRIVLTSPGIFPDGWRLPGMETDGSLSLPGLRARVVAAAVSRAETVSGWDLASRQPKPAQKTASSGSVYWLDKLDATEEALRKLAEHGLWSEPCEDPQRRAEGFNRFSFATY